MHRLRVGPAHYSDPITPQLPRNPVPDNELNENEERIAVAMGTGRLVDLRGSDQPVKAAVLARLLKGAGTDAVALRVRGARITGHLNLGGCQIPIPVDFRDCVFTGKILLAKSRVPELSLRGSYCPHGVSARGLRVDGALNLQDVRMDSTLYLKRLRAEILFLDGAHLRGPTYALQLRGAEVTQELYCGRGFTAHGRMFMYGIKVGGQLVLNGATMDNPEGPCLVLINSEVGQDLQLRGARTNGTVLLTKAKIGGNLEFTAMAASSPGNKALAASMIEVEQNVLLNHGFSAIGEVDFFLARIGGRLEVDGAWLSNVGGSAFDVSRGTVGQSLLLNGLAAEGAVRVGGSKIAGQLSLNTSTILNPAGDAFDATQCDIGQSLWIGRGSHFEGDINLTNASVTNRLMLRDTTATAIKAFDLTVDILDDDPDCWPDDSKILGMTYRSLPEDPGGQARKRIAWLSRLVPRYKPQPYTQLVSVYKGIGSNAEARLVIFAREAAQRRSHRNPVYRAVTRGWGGLLRWTIGFGYTPWRVVPWMAALFLAAWAVFRTPNAFLATDRAHEQFNAALQALDTVLPVIALDNDRQWSANGVFAWWEAGFASMGWFLSLLVAAGVAGVFKRD
ncbi:MAG: hypothetical protein ACRD0P_10395 [Stackebrandtia sp.]